MATSHTGISPQSLDFCQETGVYRAEFDTETTTPSLAVVTAYVEALEVDPTDMDQLYDSVDPDALDGLLGRGTDTDFVVEVTFEFENRPVAVTSDGIVRIDDRNSDQL